MLSDIKDPQFSLASISALIENFENSMTKCAFGVVGPIIGTKTDSHEEYAQDFILPNNKSKRGRHKKEKKKERKFRSNITFIIRLYIHRLPKHDLLSQTSVPCKVHENCEVCAKSYTMRIFNGGKIVCVGIKHQNKQDFTQCADILRRYLAKHKTLQYSAFKLLPTTMRQIYEYYYNYYRIVNVESTLENYQFPIGYNINLYALKDLLIRKSRACIINVDYQNLYKFITDSINEKKYDIDIDWLAKTLSLKNSVRKDFVDQIRFIEQLKTLDLKMIERAFELFWIDFYSRHEQQISYNYIKFFKYSTLKLFIIKQLQPMRAYCDYLDDDVFESVLFKETKNTLIIKKLIGTRSISYRIFVTGIINIQGSNNYDTAKIAQLKILEILTEDVLYDPRAPKLVSWRDLI